MTTAVYPGSFDPVTNGHLDIIERASKIFDKLVIGVLNNKQKKSLFTSKERVKMLEDVTGHLSNVEVCSFEGLLIDFAHIKEAGVIVRGLRAITDFEYELQISQTNKVMAADIETVFFTTNLKYSYLSSSMVKEIVSFGGDISAFVDDRVARELVKKFREGQSNNGCKTAFMDRDKVLVDRNTLLELLQELRDNIPEEVATYQKVISNRNAIIDNAKAEADTILTKANRMTEQLVDEHEIMQKAYETANKLVDDANSRAAEIMDGATEEANRMLSAAVKYTDDMLANLESIINHSIESSTSRFDQYLITLKDNMETVSNNRYELSKSIHSQDNN